MNFFVAGPDWGFWIIAYFYLGGVAAGSYFLAVLIEWFGPKEARPLAGIGYRLAFPLVLLCAVCLIVDLGRPERFWHMMFKSEVVKAAFAAGFPFTGPGWELAVRAPILKFWSPMSAGSSALAVFGACSFVSFAAEVWGDVRGLRWLRAHWLHRVLQVVGCLAAFFVASYTGVLLEATNQPMWSDTTWLGPLFLASAASTSLAAMTLIARRWKVRTAEARERLEGAETWAMGLEFAALVAFAISLWAYLPAVLSTVRGVIFLGGTLLVGILTPLAFQVTAARRRWVAPAAAACVLVGGLLLRYGAVTTPSEMLARGPTAAVAETGVGTPPGWLDDSPWLQRWLAPEEARAPGEPGADPNNRAGPIVTPRSKLPHVDPPEKTSEP
jgi:formate-dependent nitrite reductase membrane component NrfD